MGHAVCASSGTDSMAQHTLAADQTGFGGLDRRDIMECCYHVSERSQTGAISMYLCMYVIWLLLFIIFVLFMLLLYLLFVLFLLLCVVCSIFIIICFVVV